MSYRRLPTNKIFTVNQYRLYNPENDIDVDNPYVQCYRKGSYRGGDAAFVRSKAGLIKAASVKCHIEYIWKFDQTDFNRTLNDLFASQSSDVEDQVNYIETLPKEIILYIFRLLNAKDISNIAQTCHYLRRIAYDNLLWKDICFSTWRDPNFIIIDLDGLPRSLRKWFNQMSDTVISSDLALDIYRANIWRLKYIALDSLDSVPSIVIGRRFIGERSMECFPTKRSVTYTSRAGVFQLVGVKCVSRIEHVVHNYDEKPWHRREWGETTRPLPIYDLRTYGLRLARTVRGQHNIGFFNRRGYYLKTDLNRKIHLSYRYFPALRFRLYSQQERVFLLCQDLVINMGISSHCYTLYELIRTGDSPLILSCVSVAPSSLSNEGSSSSSASLSASSEEDVLAGQVDGSQDNLSGQVDGSQDDLGGRLEGNLDRGTEGTSSDDISTEYSSNESITDNDDTSRVTDNTERDDIVESNYIEEDDVVESNGTEEELDEVVSCSTT